MKGYIMDIYEIKRETAKTEPHFFSRDTMRFFGQTLKDFHVKKLSDNRFYIYAESEHGKTERIYNHITKELERL